MLHQQQSRSSSSHSCCHTGCNKSVSGEVQRCASGPVLSPGSARRISARTSLGARLRGGIPTKSTEIKQLARGDGNDGHGIDRKEERMSAQVCSTRVWIEEWTLVRTCAGQHASGRGRKKRRVKSGKCKRERRCSRCVRASEGFPGMASTLAATGSHWQPSAACLCPSRSNSHRVSRLC